MSLDTVKIYGSSDDNVEVDGNVPGCDEYGSFDHPMWIQFSTGDVFKVEYGRHNKGVWTVDHIEKSGKLATELHPYGEGDDPEPYTQTLIASAKGKNKIEWVEAWKEWPINSDQIKAKVEDVFDCEINIQRGIFNGEDILKLWDVIAAAKRRKAATK